METPARATSVPKPLLPVYEAIVSLTDAVCDEHLDSEYKALSRGMAAALCRKRQSPLGSGQPKSWACGIIYVLGRVNCLDDPSFLPHMKTTELAAAFGVSEATIHAKARVIEKALDVNALDPRWTAPSRIEHNPLTWMAEVGGFIVDLRVMPRDVQEQALDAGLIPFIPARSEGLTAPKLPSVRLAWRWSTCCQAISVLWSQRGESHRHIGYRAP